MKNDWQTLRVQELTKQFPDGPVVLADVNLTIERGSFLCILGPSGSGKTTLADLIAGFEQPTKGFITFDDAPIRGPGPDRVMILQDIGNALFPWLTVLENTQFGLKRRIRNRRERREMAMQWLELVGLANDSHKFPSELSGGMKQRAQIARGMVLDPHVLIMDEPFAALDAITRRRMQYELKHIWETTQKTVIFVAHDIAEAIILATEVTVLSTGPKAGILDTFRPEIADPYGDDHRIMEVHRRIESLISKRIDPGLK